MSADAAPSASPTTPEPAKKRKKKRKGVKPGDSAGREGWPAFALGFPSNAAIEALVNAFEQGNYARVREGAQRLLAERAPNAPKTKLADRPDREAEPSVDDRSDREAVQRAARELLRRIEPDPIAVYMLAGAVVLLVLLSLWYWLHPHGSP